MKGIIGLICMAEHMHNNENLTLITVIKAIQILIWAVMSETIQLYWHWCLWHTIHIYNETWGWNINMAIGSSTTISYRWICVDNSSVLQRFSPSGEQPEQRILAYNRRLYMYCDMCQDTIMRVHGAWIKIYPVLCPKLTLIQPTWSAYPYHLVFLIWYPYSLVFLIYGIHMPLFPHMVILPIVLGVALLWAAMDSPLSQGPLLWRHNEMTVIVSPDTRGRERDTRQRLDNANARRLQTFNR